MRTHAHAHTRTHTQKKAEEYQRWVPISRGDAIPSNAIYGGTYGTDGKMYVGQFNGVPGKLNTENGKMWNCWVQGVGSSPHAEILVTNKKIQWISYNKGDTTPDGAVGGMQTGADGQIVVAKTHSDEIGKLNLDGSRLNNLWSHAQGKSTSGKILVLG